jgi:NADH-quinone oxidoreductase subunit J
MEAEIRVSKGTGKFPGEALISMEAINNLINSGAVEDVLFYVFATLTLLCAILVIANPFSRSPVTSAMFLVLTIISMAGLFVLLHAFFLAAVQIIVYAGAVMVLFLFVIMLLDLKEEQRRRVKVFGFFGGIIAVGGIISILVKSLTTADAGADAPSLEGGTNALGKLLFTQYTLPFEIVSVLLLVAMIGVILLSKKKLE